MPNLLRRHGGAVRLERGGHKSPPDLLGGGLDQASGRDAERILSAMRTSIHPHHHTFLAALHGKRRLRLTFFSKEDGTTLIRETAPFDHGPSRRARDSVDRYHFHDFDSDTAPHTLSLVPAQIHSIEPLPKTFDPERLVTWDVSKRPWFVRRDWCGKS